MRQPRRGRGPLLPAVRRHNPAECARHGDRSVRNSASFDSRMDSPYPVIRLDPSSATRLRRPTAAPPEREALSKLQQRDIGDVRRLPHMRGPGAARRRGRRGRRTAGMIRAAQERIQDLFSLAESEVRRSPDNLSQRYVLLARKIGMRYNVRLLREYRDVYCRGCSAFWVEGRSVRTRLRSGRRTQTCLQCGRVRRVAIKHRTPGLALSDVAPDRAVRREQAVLIDEGLNTGFESESDDSQEE
jgi:ribonuclease P protein subunit RPR2